MLKDQIEFLKQELAQRNHTIDCLLATVDDIISLKKHLSANDCINNNSVNKSVNKSVNNKSVGKINNDSVEVAKEITYKPNDDLLKTLDTRNVTIRKSSKNASKIRNEDTDVKLP